MSVGGTPGPIVLHGSRILVGAGALDACGADVRAALPGRRLAIVSDDRVASLYAARLAAACGFEAIAGGALLTIPAGEASKTRKQWSRVTDNLITAGFGRDSAILALGGGVVGDLAGFVAATYMRGIPVVQVPTSLLAMIDAAIGGKTGVDTRAGKNLVGAFHHPTLVIADPRLLATLPAAHLRNGLAEAVKHAVIASPSDFTWLASNAGTVVREGGPDSATAEHLVRRNIQIKADIVARDERENGVRKTLNSVTRSAMRSRAAGGFTMLHGECIAVGMVVEARIAGILGVGDAGLADAIATLLRDVGLPTAVPRGPDRRRDPCRDANGQEGAGGRRGVRIARETGRDGGPRRRGYAIPGARRCGPGSASKRLKPHL